MNLSTTKLIASLAAITTVVTSFAPVLTSVTRADSEEDMAAYEWAYDEAITTMTSYEKFMPFANLTREAAARFLVMGAQALGLDMESDQDCDYEDLDSADQTLVEFIEEGCAMGIFKAQENFNPKNLLTRAQAELTLARVIWGFDAVEDYADEYDLDEYEAARELLMDADIVRVEVDGQSPVLRLHLVLMLSRLTDFDFPEDCIEGVDCPVLPGTGDNGTGDDIEVKAGSIELSMASAPANFSSVPKIGVVSFGKFSFAAGSDDVNVRSVEVERRGLGARSDIQRIWFERNGVRVSGRASLTSDNKAVITFSPALVVKRNAAEQLELVVNLSGGDAGSEHMFAFLGVESSAVNATMNPSILTTPTLRTTTYTVANAEFQNLGTALTHRAGDINSLELGQFRLSNVRPSGSTEDKDIVVQSIKFRNISDGDVETSLANVALYRNSTKVSTEAMMDGKDITFVLNDVIKASENGVYYIRGDVTNVDNTSGDNYQFQLRNTEDLNVIEQSTRFRSTVTLGSSSSYTLANYKVE